MDSSGFLHPIPMIGFQFKCEDMAEFHDCMSLNRDRPSILVHAMSGGDLVYDTEDAKLLGEPIGPRLDAMREGQEKKLTGELPRSARQVFELAA